MKIAILTSGILPVPAVQGGAVEQLIDHYLEYNNRHCLHDITVFSVWHEAVEGCRELQSEVNHYRYIDVSSRWARIRKGLHGLLHRHTYYHYSMDFFFRQAMKVITGNDYDIIVLENRPGYALHLRGKTRARLIYHLHNDLLNSSTLCGGAIYEAADGILAVSDYIRRRVATCNERDEKTVTVYNGIDVGAFAHPQVISREQIGFKADDFVLVFSGRLIREKGILELVEAMRMLKEVGRIKLLIIGSSFYDNSHGDSAFITELKGAAAELADRIVFTGYVKHSMMGSYLHLADVAVIPSLWEEPFGLTIVEGMAAGLPVITTDGGGIPEIVTEGNAIVLPLSDNLSGSLAKAILHLYKNEDMRKRMGEVSRRLSVNYSKEAYAKNFFDAI